MNEQTKTQLAHMSEITVLKDQINELQGKYDERRNMCRLYYEHCNDLNKQISDLKTQMTVASECHDSRIKDLSDRDILITQLQTTIYDILDRLKSDSKSKFCSATTRKYADSMFDLIEYQYFENTGKNLTDND